MLERVYWWYKLEIASTPEEAMALCRESLNTLEKRYKLQHTDQPESEIIAKTNWSWSGFGDLIWIKVSKLPLPLVRIDISSQPYMQGFAWDFGGNRCNVEGVVDFIVSRLQPNKIALIETIRPKQEVIRAGD